MVLWFPGSAVDVLGWRGFGLQAGWSKIVAKVDAE